VKLLILTDDEAEELRRILHATANFPYEPQRKLTEGYRRYREIMLCTKSQFPVDVPFHASQPYGKEFEVGRNGPQLNSP
jgi:hypothetical protein